MALNADFVEQMLDLLGEDTSREGLRDTPVRVAKAWMEWTSGYGIDPHDILKTFEESGCDELVLVRDIWFHSHCEHHLAPFFGVVHIGYIPNGKVVGLSKFPRLVDVFARRLSIQERITRQIADAIDQCLSPLGVGVVVEARHLCMESRGIARPGTVTVTSALRGAIREEPDARAEFLSLTRSRPNVAV